MDCSEKHKEIIRKILFVEILNFSLGYHIDHIAGIEFRILNLDHVENVDPAKFTRLRELESFSAKNMEIADVGFLRNCPKLRRVYLENVKSGEVPTR